METKANYTIVGFFTLLVIAAAFQQRLVDRAAIDGVLARLTRMRRRQLIEETVRDASEGSETVTELDLMAPVPRRRTAGAEPADARRGRGRAAAIP